MGKFLGRSENRTLYLKLESQRIVEFNGNLEEWQKWKNRTKCTFDGSEYEHIWMNKSYATRMSHHNIVVYSQLSVATSGGTAYHLIKQFHDENNGPAVWQALIKLYDGDVLKAETADAVKKRIENYQLGNGC
eukprot:10829916-Ditylum_brightwellii.AAC.1